MSAKPIYYRKLWEQAYGPIPKDDEGRSYEIHHIDGNRNNNSLENLMCVSIEEHYLIHYEQGDWAACQGIIKRMNLAPDVMSERCSFFSRKRVEDGTHNFLDGSIQRETNKKRIENRTHNFLKENKSEKIKANDWTSEFMSELQRKRVEDGTHNFTSDYAVERNKKLVEEERHVFQTNNPTHKRMKNGTHNFLKNHPSRQKWKCLETGEVANKASFTKRAKKMGLTEWPYSLEKE